MRIQLFLFGLLILCIPLFRQEFFVLHSTIFPLYFFLFPIGLLIILKSFSLRSNKRFFILLGVFTLIELGIVGSVWYMAHYQRSAPLPESYAYWVRAQYGSVRATTNFDTDLSCYDSSLTYRFQKNVKGRFKNPEFDVEIETNSLGVRDDEASVKNPGIVVLGDSHGMGWGIEKDERFSEILENRLHTNVLNTCIASYGTYRQSKLLRQVNLDSCKLLIIQYCDNDLEENRTNYPKPQKSSTDAYGFTVASRHNKINKTYFPFKGVFTGLRWLLTSGIKSAFQPAPSPTAPKAPAKPAVHFEHANAFFPYIKEIRKRYKGPIVVFDLGVYNHPLVTELEAYQLTHPEPGVHFLNVHALLKRDNYFTIDDHINASGHAKIGDALANLIRSNHWF